MNPENFENKSVQNEEITLKEIIRNFQELYSFLIKKWVTILILGLLGGILGLAYSFFKKPVYTAITTFVLEDEKGSGNIGNLTGLASMAGVDLGAGGGGIFQGENIISLYKSRTMLVQTLLTTVNINGKSELLVNRYIDFNNLRDRWESKLDLSKLRFALNDSYDKPERLRDSILSDIVKSLNEDYLSVAKPDKKLSTIRVDVKAKDEIFAKAFNDELVRNVNEFYIITKTKKAIGNVNILQHKKDSVQRVMNGAIYTAVAVADATPNLNPTRQIQRVAPAQKAQFSAETNKAILGEMVKNLELSKMTLLKEKPLIQVIDVPVYPLKVDKVGKLKGIAFGGLFGGFLIVIILSIKFYLKKTLSEEL